MSEHRLAWSCEEDTASAAADAAMHQTLLGMSTEELVRCYGAGECPTMAGPDGRGSRMQGINMTRHVLRERMSPYKFNHLPGMGSQSGALAVAEAFEAALHSYLAEMKIPFKDEAQQKEEHRAAQSEGIKLPGAAFTAAGIDGQGRQLFAGACADCGGACTVPFKPIQGKSPPKCSSCRTPLLTPDVLFSEPTFINGSRVHWLDCKAFYGSPNITTVCASLAEQARKYGERWGPGGFVFACGFAENLVVACQTGAPILLGTACLDMRHVDALVDTHLAASSS